MVLLGFGLNMMLLWVSASISQELLALSLGSEAPGSPCPIIMRISLIVASNFYLSARFGLIELCFGYDALCYLISRAHDPMSPKCTNIFVSPKDVS